MQAARQWRTIVAEFLATMLLLATVVGSGIMGQRLSGGNDALALLANSLATGAMLFVLIIVFAPLSGAHMNPAVSLVAALRRELDPVAFGFFLVAQIAGAVTGVILAHAMFDLPLLQIAHTQRTGWGQWIAEGVATFGLLLTIGGTAHRARETVAAAVALYITAAYWFTASTSFANPAVTLARALTNSFAGIAPADAPAFVAAQLAGALLALALLPFLAKAANDGPPTPENP